MKPNKPIFTFFTMMFLLLFSPVLFAAEKNELLISALRENKAKDIKRLLEDGADPKLLLEVATNQVIEEENIHTFILINQEDLLRLALKNGAKFSDIKIKTYTKLPSMEAAKIMLENKIDLNDFLALILRGDCEEYNYGSGGHGVSEELLARKTELVELALEKGADPKLLLEAVTNQVVEAKKSKFFITINQADLLKLALKNGAKFSDIKIKTYTKLPSMEAAKIMLENKIDLKDFLALLSGEEKFYGDEVSKESIAKRNELKELVLEKGGDSTYY